MPVLAVIPARAGSKGLPGKNLKLLAGLPMLAWTVRAALASTRLDRVVVSTEDPEVARVAREHGADVPFLRPLSLAQDDSSIVDVLRHAVRESGAEATLVVLLQPTSPLRTAAHIDAAVALVADARADSSETVALDGRHPFHRYYLEGGRLRLWEAAAPEASRRQDHPPVYRPTGGVYAVRAGVLAERGSLRGDEHRAVVVDEASAVDVDTAWDFELAQWLASRRPASAP